MHRDYTHPSADTVRVATLVTSIVSGDSNASEVRMGAKYFSRVLLVQ